MYIYIFKFKILMMKRTITVLILLTNSICNSQSWTYKKSGNAFDGEYKVALVTGKGNNLLYNKPTLILNKFLKTNNLNFYITNAGYFNSNENLSFRFIFDNEIDSIYSLKSNSLSKDGKTIFLESLINEVTEEELNIFKFLNKLKVANKLFVRYSDEYGNKDITFPLAGSFKAIEFVISSKEIQKQINQEEKKFKYHIEASTHIIELVSNYQLITKEKKEILNAVHISSKEKEYDVLDIDSLKIEHHKRTFFNLKLYGIREDSIIPIKNIFLPTYYNKIIKVKQEKAIWEKIITEKERIKGLFNEYNISDTLFVEIFQKHTHRSILSFSKERSETSGFYNLALMFVLSKPKLSVYLSINIIQIRQSWKKQLQN